MMDSIMDNPIWETGYQTGCIITKSIIFERLNEMPDKWFEAPWGLQSWSDDEVGKRLITGQVIGQDEVLYVRLSDVIEILRNAGKE